jgi:competence ComEA-like helix-hairpin-helix protein
LLEITPQERLALGVTALLLAAGMGARMIGDRETAGAAPVLEGTASIAAPMEQALARAEEERIRTRPLAEGERIDPNQASVVELQRLPRVGPALAARIVAHREANGAFRSLADLDAVPGVGPAMLASLAPLVMLPPAPPPAPPSLAPSGPAGPSRAATSRDGPTRPIDVNRASAHEMEALPGIGPAIARRIVEHRTAHGPFRSAADLEKVPGIGPKLRERLAAHVRFDP